MTGTPHMNLETRLSRDLGAAQTWLMALSAHTVLEALSLDSCRIVKPLEGTPVTCLDLKELGRAARDGGEPLVVDASLPGPGGCAAVRLGASLALCELEGLCVVGVSRDAERWIPGVRVTLDELAQQAPANASDAERQLAEKAQQWHVTSDAAQVVASYLRCHPRVEQVRYPGLRGDPSFTVAARTLVGGFGPVVDYTLQGEEGWCRWRCTNRDPRDQILHLEVALAESPTPPLNQQTV